MKKEIIAAALVLGSMTTAATAAEVSGNAGFVSEYLFRGVPQTDGNAAAQGGLDVAYDTGFYVGTWASSVDNGTDSGVEVDLYGGWGGEAGDFSYGIGGTYYTYTDDVDEDYAELNLSGGWKWFTVDVAIGEYDSEPTTQDYTFVALTAEYEGLYLTYGDFGDDFEGSYIEAGYGDTLSAGGEDLFDWSISVVRSEDKLLGKADDDTTLIFGIVKGFDINL